MAVSDPKFKAQGLDGLTYRVEINGGGTSVDADRSFLTIEGGEPDDEAWDPIWPKRARISLKDVDISPLFGLASRSVDVEIYDDSSGELVYRGFMITDKIKQAPFISDNAVEIQALDGLGTLGNDTLDSIYSGTDPDTEDYATVTDAISEILGTPYTMEVEFGVHWYPDATGIAVGSGDCPLAQVGFDPDNYREDRPKGDWLTQLDVLRDLCKAFGLTIRQADRRDRSEDAKWHVRQRDGIQSNGDIKVWRFDNTGSELSGQPITLSRSRTIATAPPDFKPKHEQSFVERRQVVEVAHDHLPVEGLIDNPGFEEGSVDWQNVGSNSLLTADIDDKSNFPDFTGPSATTNDQKILASNTQTTQSSPSLEPVTNQPLGTLVSTPPEAYARLSFEIGGYDFTVKANVELKIGGKYLTLYKASPQQTSLPGQTEIAVDPLDRPIPVGARLPIVNPSNDTLSTGDVKKTSSSLSVSERAPEGATRIRGELSEELEDTSWEIWYLGFAGSATTVNALPFNETWDLDKYSASDGFYFRTELRGELVDGNGDSVDGDASVELYQWADTADRAHYWDNFEAGIEVGGSPLDKTVTQAGVPEYGKKESQTARLFSGPTNQNLARLRGNDTNGDDFEPTDWDVGYKLIDGDPEVDSGASAGATSVDIYIDSNDLISYEVGQRVTFAGHDTVYFTDHSLLTGSSGVYTVELQSGLTTSVSAGEAFDLAWVTLAELKAYQRARYWQLPNTRYRVTQPTRSGTLPLNGDELVTLDGDEYTVHSIKYDAATGETRATLIEWTDYQ